MVVRRAGRRQAETEVSSDGTSAFRCDNCGDPIPKGSTVTIQDTPVDEAAIGAAVDDASHSRRMLENLWEMIPAADTERRRAVALEFVAFLEGRYEQSAPRNPLLAWTALWLCLKASVDVPRWVASYLITAADSISQISGGETNTDHAVAAALLLSTQPGQDTIWQIRDRFFLHEWRLADLVEGVLRENRFSHAIQRQAVESGEVSGTIEPIASMRWVYEEAARRHADDACPVCDGKIGWKRAQEFYLRLKSHE